MDDMISRQAAIDALCSVCGDGCDKSKFVYDGKQEDQVILCPEHYVLTQLPSAQPPKEITKRVLWSGWKGCRDTRYKCPNCEKPVRNDDTYCHRCGQRLMFPKISFTDYVPGEKQDVIVRWDDEG